MLNARYVGYVAFKGHTYGFKSLKKFFLGDICMTIIIQRSFRLTSS